MTVPPSRDMEGNILALRTVIPMIAQHVQQTHPRNQQAMKRQIATAMQAWVDRAHYGLIIMCEK